MDGWRNTIPVAQQTSVNRIQEIFLAGGKTPPSLVVTFVTTFLIVYILLLLIRPSVVVYKSYGETVPTFHHGAALLWSFIAGLVSIGLVFVG